MGSISFISTVFRFRKAFIIALLCTVNIGVSYSQKCVVVDAKTGDPVVHASLYSRDNGQFKAVISKADGTAVVNFPFRRLTVSHLNYEQLVVDRLQDTIRLMPKEYMTSEVVEDVHLVEVVVHLAEAVDRGKSFYLTMAFGRAM